MQLLLTGKSAMARRQIAVFLKCEGLCVYTASFQKRLYLRILKEARLFVNEINCLLLLLLLLLMILFYFVLVVILPVLK